MPLLFESLIVKALNINLKSHLIELDFKLF